MRVSATDVDEGENQKITYDLRAEKYPADIEYFRWDEKTGEVWLSKKLDKPVSSVFVLKVSRRCQLQDLTDFLWTLSVMSSGCLVL